MTTPDTSGSAAHAAARSRMRQRSPSVKCGTGQVADLLHDQFRRAGRQDGGQVGRAQCRDGPAARRVVAHRHRPARCQDPPLSPFASFWIPPFFSVSTLAFCPQPLRLRPPAASAAPGRRFPPVRLRPLRRSVVCLNRQGRRERSASFAFFAVIPYNRTVFFLPRQRRGLAVSPPHPPHPQGWTQAGSALYPWNSDPSRSR